MNWRFAELKWRLLPGGIAALLSAGLWHLGACQPLENLAYPLLFQLRQEQQWDSRLALIKIDDASLKKMGPFPWSRKRYAELLQQLTRSQASVVAFDIWFSEPKPEEDEQFAQAMAQQVILAQAEDPATGQPLLSVPKLQNAALGSGHIRVVSDPDGFIRKIEPLSQGASALGLATIEAYALRQEQIPLPDTQSLLWLNWAGKVEHIPQYSFADVVEGKVSNRAFYHKIVLVGMTSAGTDPARTPFNPSASAYGVHLQATLIHNLLQQNLLHPVDQPAGSLLLFLSAPILAWILSGCRVWQQLVLVGAGVVLWVTIGVVCLQFNYLLPIVGPLTVLLSTAIATAFTERRRLYELMQQQIQQLQQRHAAQLALQPTGNLPVPFTPQSYALTPTSSLQSLNQLAALTEHLAQAQSNQLAIARSLPIGLVAADIQGVVWFCNPMAAQLLRIDVGTRLSHYLVPDWLSSATLWQASITQLRQQQSVHLPDRCYGGRWFSLQLEPLSDSPVIDSPVINSPAIADFRLTGMLMLLKDITDRKTVEVTLDQQVQDLHHLSDLKDEFLNTVSHELRAPLTNMKLAIQMLKLAETETQRADYLQILDDECSREADLINELLDLQRIESGLQPIDPELIPLQTWLGELLEPFYKRTAARNQTLVFSCAPALPDLVSDRSSVERIILELINNACKYTPPGHNIIVTATCPDLGDDFDLRPDLHLIIENTGIEIPTEELPRIFERFYRIPTRDRSKPEGTGLGLALVKKLVEQLAGNITATSGGGYTTFIVILPQLALPPSPPTA